MASELIADEADSEPIWARGIYLPAILDTGLPGGNVHERDSGPMQGAIPTESHDL